MNIESRTKQVSIIKMEKIREKYAGFRFDGYEFDNGVLRKYKTDTRIGRNKIVKDQ